MKTKRISKSVYEVSNSKIKATFSKDHSITKAEGWSYTVTLAGAEPVKSAGNFWTKGAAVEDFEKTYAAELVEDTPAPAAEQAA